MTDNFESTLIHKINFFIIHLLLASLAKGLIYFILKETFFYFSSATQPAKNHPGLILFVETISKTKLWKAALKLYKNKGEVYFMGSFSQDDNLSITESGWKVKTFTGSR